MQDSDSEKLKLPDEDSEQFEQRLVMLLSSGPLDIAGKASNLRLEYERFLQEARIITDIRPIFGADLSEPPSGALVAHTLKLTYWDEKNESRDLYIALDAVDIRNLSDLLERAKTKANSLQAMLGAVAVPFVDVE
jgi:hypothetical protein